MAKEPNTVVQSSREVIERKLLAALDDPECVAILASKDDLDLLVFCLAKAVAQPSGYLRNETEALLEIRARELRAGLEQLRREAFGE